MSHYKAYLITRDGHHIRAVDLECVDDDAARKCAEQMTDVSNVELWEHARRIAKFSSKSVNGPNFGLSPKASSKNPNIS